MPMLRCLLFLQTHPPLPRTKTSRARSRTHLSAPARPNPQKVRSGIRTRAPPTADSKSPPSKRDRAGIRTRAPPTAVSPTPPTKRDRVGIRTRAPQTADLKTPTTKRDRVGIRTRAPKPTDSKTPTTKRDRIGIRTRAPKPTDSKTPTTKKDRAGIRTRALNRTGPHTPQTTTDRDGIRTLDPRKPNLANSNARQSAASSPDSSNASRPQRKRPSLMTTSHGPRMSARRSPSSTPPHPSLQLSNEPTNGTRRTTPPCSARHTT